MFTTLERGFSNCGTRITTGTLSFFTHSRPSKSKHKKDKNFKNKYNISHIYKVLITFDGNIIFLNPAVSYLIQTLLFLFVNKRIDDTLQNNSYTGLDRP